MTLTEIAAVPGAALPVQVLRDHLRMGSGFSDDAVQDGLLETYLRAALAAVEGHTGKALIARDFLWATEGWRDAMRAVLPLAPVQAVAALVIRDRAGGTTAVAPTAYLLVRDTHAPCLTGAGSYLPSVPEGGTAEVTFTAGFGPWAAVPADLGQAVLLLAAHFHEHRHATGDGAAGLPFGVMALLDRWRAIRIRGGRA
jgi:uncharacterized phiE125 gp8 family phage protein